MYLVWGLGRSGLAAVELLRSKGYEVVAGDDTKNPELWRGVLKEVECVVLSPGVPPSHPLWREAEKLGIELIGETELAYRLFNGKVVAVTGTDGKTTTTELIYRMLRKENPKVHKAGNIGIPFSEIVRKSTEGVTVLEVSSFQGKTLKSFRPHVGVFLNFSVDHLDWHPSVEDYLKSKYRIFANQMEEDLLVLANNQMELLQTPSRARKLLLWKEAEITAKTLRIGDVSLNLKDIKLKGKHNLKNILTAVAVALEMDIPPGTIEEVVYSFEGLPHRLELVAEEGGLRVYNDSKSTTVNSLRAALESFEDGRVVLVAGGKDKGDDFSLVRELAKRKVKKAFLIGETAEKIADSWKGVDCEPCRSLEEAVNKAVSSAETGDCILFSPACSSFDMFRNYADRGERFKRLVSSALGLND